MATTRLIPLHVGEGRSAGTAIRDIIEYVENPDKTDGFQLVTGYQCDSRSADMEFMFAKKLYEQKTGRVRGRDNVIAYHLRQSFAPGEITPEEANRLGRELAKRFTKGRHAFVVATHIDKHHIHNHIIINSVALDHSRKLRNFWGSFRAIQRLNDTVCIENGYSIVELPQFKGKSYNKWEGDVSRLSHRDRLCLAIDDALSQKPRTFDAFLAIMKQKGYEVKGTANPSFRGGLQKRGIRMDKGFKHARYKNQTHEKQVQNAEYDLQFCHQHRRPDPHDPGPVRGQDRVHPDPGQIVSGHQRPVFQYPDDVVSGGARRRQRDPVQAL